MYYFLETSRIGYRPWTVDDFILAKRLWGNPQVTQHISSKNELSDEEILNKLNIEIENLKKFGVQYWPIYSKDDGEFLGVCGLRPYKLFDGVFEMGVHLLPEYWNNGIGYEASKAMISYTFNTLNISSIFAGHNPQNQVSAILLKKLGFRFTHYEFYPPTGLNHPSYIINKDDLLELD